MFAAAVTRYARKMSALPAFVIKAEELAVLNYLDRRHPRPRKLEWINRGTDQLLKISSVQMLLRTLFREVSTPSVRRLHRSSGLRAVFRTVRERDTFAKDFAAARIRERESQPHLATAIFDDRQSAQRAVTALKGAGFGEPAISIMWRGSKFLDPNYRWSEGHSPLSVAGAVAGGSLAGAVFGVAVLIPQVGAVAASGALAASAFSSMASLSGIIGGTGGALAKMLTDHDVDGVAAKLYEEEVQRGKVFVFVDTRNAAAGLDDAYRILAQNRGRTVRRNGNDGRAD